MTATRTSANLIEALMRAVSHSMRHKGSTESAVSDSVAISARANTNGMNILAGHEGTRSDGADKLTSPRSPSLSCAWSAGQQYK